MTPADDKGTKKAAGFQHGSFLMCLFFKNQNPALFPR
jgi:hypothetical protein